MHPLIENHQLLSRRLFFGRSSLGLGSVALASLLEPGLLGDDAARVTDKASGSDSDSAPGLAGFPNLPAKAKRVIYLFQSGAPSQMDLFDPKPHLANLRGTE